MSKQWQLRRGTTAENNGFTGAQGELTMDTERKELRLHDGTTQGGVTFVSQALRFPNYTSGVALAQNTDYTADTDCWLYVYVKSGTDWGGDIVRTLYIDGVGVIQFSTIAYNGHAIFVPCAKGSSFQLNGSGGNGSVTFIKYPCKGN